MSGSIFFAWWISWISRCFPAAIFQTESRVSCPRELRKVLRKRAGSGETETNEFGVSWVRRKILRMILSDPNNLVSQALDQSCVSSRSRKLTRITNQNPTMCSQERQQDDTQSSSTRKWMRRDESSSSARARKQERSEDIQIGKSKMEWKSTICKSPTIDTSRKSSRTCWKSWASQRKHQLLVSKRWRPRTDLGIICVDNDGSRHSSWTKLRWNFRTIQKHRLRTTSEFIRHHSEVDIGPSSKDSKFDKNCWDISFVDEIYTFSRSSDHVDESKSTRPLRFPSYAWRKCQKRIEDGKIKNKINNPILTENYKELLENRLSSSGIFSQDSRHWKFSKRSRKTCKLETLSPKSLKIESSSCQCSMTSNGQREVQRNVFRIPNESRITRRDSRKDTGHSSALETTRNGVELSVFRLKEHEILPPHRWCGRFKETGHPVLKSISALSRGMLKKKKARITELPYTSMRMLRIQNSHFERLTQQISSVSTEQSPAGVKHSAWGRTWKRDDFRKVYDERKWAITERSETARSKFFGANSKEWWSRVWKEISRTS